MTEDPKYHVTFAAFQQIMAERFKYCTGKTVEKHGEYDREDDKLHNFKVQAEIGKMTIGEAIKGNALKHFASIWDILDDLDKGVVPSDEVIAEKIGDAIIYLLLMETYAWEKKEGQSKHERYGTICRPDGKDWYVDGPWIHLKVTEEPEECKTCTFKPDCNDANQVAYGKHCGLVYEQRKIYLKGKCGECRDHKRCVKGYMPLCETYKLVGPYIPFVKCKQCVHPESTPDCKLMKNCKNFTSCNNYCYCTCAERCRGDDNYHLIHRGQPNVTLK